MNSMQMEMGEREREVGTKKNSAKEVDGGESEGVKERKMGACTSDE